MRTRKEIEDETMLRFRLGNETGIAAEAQIQATTLEVLLDIRELLEKAANPLYQIRDGSHIQLFEAPEDTTS